MESKLERITAITKLIEVKRFEDLLPGTQIAVRHSFQELIQNHSPIAEKVAEKLYTIFIMVSTWANSR
jgi:hypothetical protein